MSLCIVDGGQCSCGPHNDPPCPGVESLKRDSARLRWFSALVGQCEGDDETFGSELAADHMLSALREDFLKARGEGLDAHAALCRAIDSCMNPEAA